MRRLAVLLAALTALMGLAAPAGAASAKFTVGIAVGARSITVGETIAITGRVSPNARGQKVSLQKRMAGSKTWRTERRATVARNGTYRFREQPTAARHRFYRVYKPSSGKRKAGYSRSVAVHVQPRRAGTVTLTATPTELDRPAPLVVSGQASTTLSGAEAYLEFLNTDDDLPGWVDAGARAPIAADGTFTIQQSSSLLTSHGNFVYRVVTTRTRTQDPAVSAGTWTTQVFDLVTTSSAFEGNLRPGRFVRGFLWDNRVSRTVNGVEHHTVAATDEPASWSEFRLDSACTDLRGEIGVADGATADRQVTFLIDGAPITSKLIAAGPPTPLDIDLTGGQVLRVEWSGAAGASLVLDARFRCRAV